VLRDFHLLDLLPEGRTITGPVLAGDADFLRTLGHRLCGSCEDYGDGREEERKKRLVLVDNKWQLVETTFDSFHRNHVKVLCPRVISTIHHRSHWQSQGNAELVASTFACEFLRHGEKKLEIIEGKFEKTHPSEVR